MINVRIPILITSYYPSIPRNPQQDKPQQVTDKTPEWAHISITNLTAARTDTAMELIGLPEMHLAGIHLSRVDIAARHAEVIVNVDGLKMKACNIPITASK